MDLGLNEAQALLRSSGRDFFERECPLSRVREIQASGGFARDLWQQVADLGWPGLVIDERYGGSGGDLVDAAVLLEEVGRALAPVPLASTAVIAARAIYEFGSEEQRQDLLPRLARGELIAAFALTEPRASYGPDGVRTRAEPADGAFTLNGTKLFVRDGTIADLLLVAARTRESASPEDGVTLLLVDAHTDGVSVAPLISSAHDRQAEIALHDVCVPASNVLGPTGRGWPAVRRLIDLGALAECAEMVGAMQRVFELSAEYAKSRVQFGRPIGSFQAIQHKVADMATDLDGARFITYYAAWKARSGGDSGADVARAKVWVSDAFRRVTREGQQIHGGVGFIVEHDLHLYFNREKTAELYMGAPSFHRRTVADAVLGPVGAG
jgi:alkylation response protein AidB-like acyl-CoA dehydrogenase